MLIKQQVGKTASWQNSKLTKQPSTSKTPQMPLKIDGNVDFNSFHKLGGVSYHFPGLGINKNHIQIKQAKNSTLCIHSAKKKTYCSGCIY
jgi:hypothetical protein